MTLPSTIAHIPPHLIEVGRILIETILLPKTVEVGAEVGDGPLLMSDARAGEDQAKRL